MELLKQPNLHLKKDKWGHFFQQNNFQFQGGDAGLLCIETIIIVFHFPNKEKLSKELAAERGEDWENMKLDISK